MYIINETNSIVRYNFGGSGSADYNSYDYEWTEIPMTSSFDLNLSDVPITSDQAFTALSASATIRITSSGAVEASGSAVPTSACCRYTNGSAGWVADSANMCPSGSACMNIEDVTMRHPTGLPGQIIEIPCQQNR